MFEVAPSIEINTPPEAVWEYFVDLEEWWLASNPEHIELQILSSNGSIGLGTEIRIEEKIAGVPGKAVGKITAYTEGKEVTWEASATYRLLGLLKISVDEGVTWRLEPAGEGTKLTAQVWADFPDSVFGRMSQWWFVNILDGKEKDDQHAFRELEYIKGEVERDVALNSRASDSAMRNRTPQKQLKN